MDSLSQQVTIIIIFTLFLVVIAVGVIFLVLVYQKRQLHYLREKDKMRNSFEQQILKAQLEIQEGTLNKIAQELHDNVGQALSLAKLTLSSLPNIDQDTQEKVALSRSLVSRSISDLRDLARSMNTGSITALGLDDAIAAELKLLEKAGKFNTTFSIEGDGPRRSPQEELIIFRIIQEALNNIIKHADAHTVYVGIRRDKENMRIDIKDDGKGYDVTHNNNGQGVMNMKHRAQLLDASFDIISSAGKGTSITILIPIHTQEHVQ